MREMRKINCFIAAFAALMLCGTAQAFNYDDCIAISKKAPYEMTPEAAKDVCDEKQGKSSTGDISPYTQEFEANPGTAKVDLAEGFREGDMVVEICVRGCTADHKPKCPSGYTLLEGSMGAARWGAYHGRYRIRSGICIRS